MPEDNSKQALHASVHALKDANILYRTQSREYPVLKARTDYIRATYSTSDAGYVQFALDELTDRHKDDPTYEILIRKRLVGIPEQNRRRHTFVFWWHRFG